MPGGTQSLEAYILTGVGDALEAIRWAKDRQEGRLVELFVEVEVVPPTTTHEQRTSGLIRLLGKAPDEGVTISLSPMVPIICADE